jgi:pre-mRNA-splicing factor ATP-dependent RNA helicase DHX15/PRP43
MSNMSNNKLFNKIGILDPNANSINPLTNKNYSNKNSYKNLSKEWSEYPMYKIKDKAIKAINDNQVVLITSGTGSGKTVLTPKFALHTYGYDAKIAITNPKKIPTKDAAEFAAKTLDVKLGEEVGYKYRGSPNNSRSNKTKLLYCTDGYIMNIMKSDPLLKIFDMVIIDEAHERNVNIDLLMVLIKRAMLVRRDLKLIIMSATIDVSKFINYFPKKDFKFEYVESPGKTYYPVEEFNLNKSIYNFDKNGIIKNMDDIINQAVNTVIYLLLTTGGGSIKNNKNNKNNKQPPEDILVFLTSGAELNKACSLLNKKLEGLSIRRFI